MTELVGGSVREAWEEYLATARRLDAVRREAAVAVAGQEATAEAARAELAYVRERLALQRREWPAAGVAIGDLAPAGPPGPPGPLGSTTPPGSPGAAPPGATVPTVAGLPPGAAEPGASAADVLDTLRRTRSMVDEADALVLGRQPSAGGIAGMAPPVRNLFVYGPLAALTLVAQLTLSVMSENPLYLLCGLVMPAAAFLLGFVAIGLLFPAQRGGEVDRTPLLGAAVCLASVLLLCAGLGIMAAFR